MVGEKKRLGTKLHGRYEIVALIAKGGMGTVFLGKHLELDKSVAIKIFHPHLTDKEEMVVRFINEARGIAKLHHRNIVNVFDIGKDEEGIPFFVMEYLTGESLRERISKLEALPIKQSLDIMVQILSGLRVAHSRGIVHRDLKPGNIFLSKEEDGSEVVKILDFGVAKFREIDPEKQGEITTDGSLLGTPSYMSPEQAKGKKGIIDHRSDIYSCGLILYRCMTGLNVFKGDSPIETIQNILYLDPAPPSFLNENLPKEVDEVVLKAIERDRDKRYQDCKTFIQALKGLYSVAGATPGELVAKIVSGEEGSDSLSYQGSFPSVRPESDLTVPTLSHGGRSMVKPASKNKGLLTFLVIALVVAAGLISGWYFFFKNRKNIQPAAEKKAQVEDRLGPEKKDSAKEDEQKQPPMEKAMVEIEIIGLVPGASVLVDGKKVESNPFELEKSESEVVVSISYEGETVLEKTLVPTGNERIHVNIPEKKKIAKGKPGGKKKSKEKTEEPSKPPEKKEKPPIKIFKDWD